MTVRFRGMRLLERNAFIYRRNPTVVLTGLLEPFLYLASIGIGVGRLIGPVGGVPYSHYVAPALLASAAMNGAIFDSTFNIYFKLKFSRTYDAILATPLGTRDIATGEVAWALTRGGIYAAVFLVAMEASGLTTSWWTLLALPVALLIGFTFSALGMAATTWIRGFGDFDLVPLVTTPLFLFSATFYPLHTYDTPLQWIARLSPLYHGVILERALCLGRVDWTLLGHAGFLLGLGAGGVWVVGRRLDRLLLT